MKVPFLDLVTHHQPLRAEILDAWARLYDAAHFAAGAEVAAFETEFAAAQGVDHCVAVSTGTDALMLILKALGTGPGDRVVVPTNSFIATAEAVSHVGATPVFVDCDPATSLLDVGAAATAVRESGAAGVMPVHLYGSPVDVAALGNETAPAGAWTVEDAAQAHLAQLDGKAVGAMGRAAGFSFYPGKNLGAAGEGGAVTTNDEELAAEIRTLRDHGQSAKYHHQVVGYNARMHELVAAALRIKLRHLPEWTEARRRVAVWYRSRLAGHALIDMPQPGPRSYAVYHLFVVHVPHRDQIRAALEAAGIGAGLHYPVPIHLQPAYADLGYGQGDFPMAERLAGSLLSLPMYPEMTEEQVELVCDVLVDAVDRTSALEGSGV